MIASGFQPALYSIRSRSTVRCRSRSSRLIGSLVMRVFSDSVFSSQFSVFSFQRLAETGEHFGDFFEFGEDAVEVGGSEEVELLGYVDLSAKFRSRAGCDPEETSEITSSTFGPFSDIGLDRDR